MSEQSYHLIRAVPVLTAALMTALTGVPALAQPHQHPPAGHQAKDSAHPGASAARVALPEVPDPRDPKFKPQDYPTHDPEVALKMFQLPEGYAVNLFASERDGVEKPIAFAVDGRGRLWVACSPTYPHALPGTEPNDKIVILEDTDGDGKSDKTTVFADRLYIPTGLELGDGGVYVAQQPNLMFLRDTDGDDRADQRTILLHGFGTEDSHHAMHAMTWSPGGALHFAEGTFHHTQVETPHGPVRVENAAYFRYRPTTQRLQVYVSYQFANPWGHVFDRWGQDFLADSSGGANYFALPLTGRIEYPDKRPAMREFTLTKVRPTCGAEFVSSRHFPDEAQGNWLLNNVIGFQGIKQYKVIEKDSGFEGHEVEPLLFSTDPNFRPVDLEFGADGALYVTDWYNPLIGHMQYSVRDPRRDTTHGRIWRITHTGRPLLKPVKIENEPVASLLDLLKSYEDRTRYRARRELRIHPKEPVAAAVKQWVGGLDRNDPEYEHHLLEALWVLETKESPDAELLNRLLKANDPRARAAATRVLRHWAGRVPDALALLRQQANDKHPRVRLEAVVALSDFKTAAAAEAALDALRHPTDYYLDYALRETMKVLRPQWQPLVTSGKSFAANHAAAVEYALGSVPTEDLVKAARSEGVYAALLVRPGIDLRVREEALKGLSQTRKTKPVEELLAAIGRADRVVLDPASAPPADSASAAKDLADLLTNFDAEDIEAAREHVERLAAEARTPEFREAAYTSLIYADESADKAWALAGASPRRLQDLLTALVKMGDEEFINASYDRALSLLRGLPKDLAAELAKNQGVRGRYVRIDLPGLQRTLTLAEVQVFSGGRNIAPTGKAVQSSLEQGGEASKAIDGNTNADFAAGGQSSTKENDRNPWWQLDLGSVRPIESVIVYNRAGEFGKRLEGYTLTVLDADRNVAYQTTGHPAPPEKATHAITGPDPVAAVRRAAINVVTAVKGKEAETFQALAQLVRDKTDTDAALEGLARLPRDKWPKEQAAALAADVIAHVSQVPPDRRSAPAFLSALAVARDLAALLPAAEASKAQASLAKLGVQTVVIKVIPHEMKFVPDEITVEAGRPVEILLENPCVMPHNLLVTAPGAMEEVGMEAEQMAADPRAFERQFVPDSKKVLAASRLLQPGQSDRIVFIAPERPDDYPYVCTFPGHWRTMNGVMTVTAAKGPEAGQK